MLPLALCAMKNEKKNEENEWQCERETEMSASLRALNPSSSLATV